MCGVARQGAAGKALPAQGFVVVVGRPKRKHSRRMPVEQEFGAFRWDRRNLLAASTNMWVCDWVMS